MNIAFRADASEQIGTGHIMRCLTLADELKKHGARIRFVSRHLPEYLRNMLWARGYEAGLLTGSASCEGLDELAHAHWLGVSQAQDAEESIAALSEVQWDWLVVDHYALDRRWEAALRQCAKNILVIDDIADRQHDCDVLLDQNFYADMNVRYQHKVPDHCLLLLGPRYALLRDEFLQWRERVSQRKGPVQRILIFFGGMDADNYTGRAMQALLCRCNYPHSGMKGIQVDVVIGAGHPRREAIEAMCRQHNFFCHVQTERMAELMAAADLAIGAGGSATWERCCVGLPTITICSAENQRRQVADAASEGLLYAPDHYEAIERMLCEHFLSLCDNGGLRSFMSRKAMEAVDSRGVLRVASRMGCRAIEIRAVQTEDSKSIFTWRNHPSIRAVSRNSDPISWEEHQRWFRDVLFDPSRVLLIGEYQGGAIGVVRFDIDNDKAEISIYLVPELRSVVRGSDLLQSAESWLAQARPEVEIIEARVLGSNERSNRLFSSAGYSVESTSYFKRLH